jgi:hypothetical protein
MRGGFDGARIGSLINTGVDGVRAGSFIRVGVDGAACVGLGVSTSSLSSSSFSSSRFPGVT